MKTYHATPAHNAISIRAEGLLPDTNQKNFKKCRPLVYVASTENSAKRWAQEIARETGYLDFSLFEVTIDEDIVFTVTSINELQATIPRKVNPSRIRFLENFTTSAVESQFSVFDKGVSGFVYCSECEINVQDSKSEMLYHLEEFHTEEPDIMEL